MANHATTTVQCFNVSDTDRVIVQTTESVVVAWVIVPLIAFFPLPQLISIARHRTAMPVSAWTLLMQWLVAGLYIYYGWSIDQWSIMSSAAFNGVFSLTSFILKFVFDGCTREAWAVHCHNPAGEREEEDRDNADLT